MPKQACVGIGVGFVYKLFEELRIFTKDSLDFEIGRKELVESLNLHFQP